MSSNIKYNAFGEVISVNGLTTGHHLGAPMQDALGTPEENSPYGTELGVIGRSENIVDDLQPKSDGDTSGEVTGTGADLWVIYNGALLDFFDVVRESGFDIRREYSVIAVVDDLPDFSTSPTSHCPLFIKDEMLYTHIRETGRWVSFQDLSGLPCHGWIDKGELDALDYSDPNNFGLYLVEKVTYPYVDRTLLNLVTEADTVGQDTFYGSCLVSITLPNVRYICPCAFESCDYLLEVNLTGNKNLEAIYASAFNICFNLQHITLPASLKKLGSNVFEDCDNLTSVTFLSPTPPTFEDLMFFGCDALQEIIVPSGSADAYKAALSEYADKIVERDM